MILKLTRPDDKPQYIVIDKICRFTDSLEEDGTTDIIVNSERLKVKETCADIISMIFQGNNK